MDPGAAQWQSEGASDVCGQSAESMGEEGPQKSQLNVHGTWSVSS